MAAIASAVAVSDTSAGLNVAVGVGAGVDATVAGSSADEFGAPPPQATANPNNDKMRRYKTTERRTKAWEYMMSEPPAVR